MVGWQSQGEVRAVMSARSGRCDGVAGAGAGARTGAGARVRAGAGPFLAHNIPYGGQDNLVYYNL